MATDVTPVAGVLGGVEPEATREPPASIRFRRRVSIVRGVKDLWRGRELIASLAERDLRARYKQAYLGFAWAVILPLVYMVIFSLFFKRVAKIDTGDVPYALFTYVGLLPWTFFSGSVSGASSSLTGNLSVLNKVFCPREIFPLAGMVVQFVDMLIATGVLLILFAVYTYPPELTAVWIPVLLLVQLAFTIGVALIVAVTTVFLRDIKHAVAIGLQLGLFATPVAYSLTAIPSDVRPFYCLINPLAPVIDGYRETVLLGNSPDLGLLGLGAIGAFTTLIAGYWIFKRLEPGIADVA